MCSFEQCWGGILLHLLLVGFMQSTQLLNTYYMDEPKLLFYSAKMNGLTVVTLGSLILYLMICRNIPLRWFFRTILLAVLLSATWFLGLPLGHFFSEKTKIGSAVFAAGEALGSADFHIINDRITFDQLERAISDTNSKNCDKHLTVIDSLEQNLLRADLNNRKALTLFSAMILQAGSGRDSVSLVNFMRNKGGYATDKFEEFSTAYNVSVESRKELFTAVKEYVQAQKIGKLSQTQPALKKLNSTIDRNNELNAMYVDQYNKFIVSEEERENDR